MVTMPEHAETQSLPEKPDSRVLTVWSFSNLLTHGILFVISLAIVGGFILFGKAGALWLAFPGAFVALALLGQVTLRKQWEHWTFQVTPEALEMSHGWLWRQRRVVARDRIQHVDINSGPLDRRFGLVQVVVYTAGTTVGMIPGLLPERAQRLRDELLEGRASL